MFLSLLWNSTCYIVRVKVRGSKCRGAFSNECSVESLTILSHCQAWDWTNVPYVVTTVPWLCQKEWDELSPFFCVLSSFDHVHVQMPGLLLHRTATSTGEYLDVSLSESLSPSISQPLSRLLVFPFVWHNMQCHLFSLYVGDEEWIS